MYFRYYGLNEKPFSLAADPRYIYYSRSHKEAYAQMIYAASQDSGFMVLSGEVGSGKTILINAVIAQLPKQYRVAKIYHTALNPEGLVKNICKEFGIAYQGGSMSQLVLRIQDFLKSIHNAGQRSLLILDEAQNLSPETLEEIRLLSNFEAAHKKVLQILLVGQPEFEEILWHKNLRQFRERVSLRYQLKKLEQDETTEYINHRLAVAGMVKGKKIFTEGAIEKVHTFTEGIPRRINILCDNAMLTGYAEDFKNINEATIKIAGAYTKIQAPETAVLKPFQPQPASKTAASKAESPGINSPAPGGTSVQSLLDPATEILKKPVVNKTNADLKTPPPIARSNGRLNYPLFEKMMFRFLAENEIYFIRKPKWSRILLGVLVALVLVIIAVLYAILFSVKLGIIK